MNVVIGTWALVALAMAALWARQLRTRDATSVDAAWATAIALLALVHGLTGGGDPGRRALVAALGGVWGLRLALHLLRDRVLRERGEDGRYRALRDAWGARAPLRFFFLYQAQALVAVLFSLPMRAAMDGGPPGPFAWAGVVVWGVALAGETVADRQLARFRARPENQGRVCREGLWKYSRHPNYFFEWLHWWTYVLIGGGAPVTWLGPALMLVFLFRVTGIPYTERQALASRGERYRAYQRTTSAFFPWFPKRAA